MLPNLYLITDRKQCSNLIDTIKMSLDGGLKLIQLREKDLSTKELFDLATEIKSLTDEYDAQLIINDRVDVALAIEADGVHIGVGSLPIDKIKALSSNSKLKSHSSKFLIGYSAHSLKEAVEVEKHVDYIFFSPIFPTPSKMKYGNPQGLEKLKEVVAKISIPVYALGGIKLSNLSDILETEVHGVALISEVIASSDPMKATRNLIDLFARR